MNLDEICNELAALQSEEDELDANIENILLKDSVKIQNAIESISGFTVALRRSENESESLEKQVLQACNLAESISKQIRQVDRVKSRVNDVLNKVDSILELNACTEGITKALSEENFEVAAIHIHRYRSLNPSDIISINSSSDIQESLITLSNAEKNLCGLARERFNLAIKDADINSIERFFKMFPLLGLHKEGLQLFSEFIGNQISDNAVINLQLADDAAVSHQERSSIAFADTFALLFESIAREVELHQPLVETYYGPGSLSAFISYLQRTCDKQSLQIFQSLKRVRELSSLNIDEIDDRAKLDSLIRELALVHERAELYQRFIGRRVFEDDENQSTVDMKQLENITHEVVGYYLNLEVALMRKSFEIAVSFDKPSTGEENIEFTSSIVDDVFFVLKRSLRRAVSTTSVNAVCAMLNNCSTLLETQFSSRLQNRLRAALPSSYLDKVLSAHRGDTSTSNTRAEFIVAINNIAQSVHNIDKLSVSFENDWKQQGGNILPHQQAKVDTCLQGLHDAANSFRVILEEGQTSLIKIYTTPALRPCFEGFTTISHSLTEEEFALTEADDLFARSFIAPLDTWLMNIKEELLEDPFNEMLNNLGHYLSSQFEKCVMKTSFNRLGGILFDRELRSLLNYLATAAKWSMREKFLRLSQIASLLNLETVGELGDLSATANWKLTPSEIRQVLRLRQDFTSQEIKAVKF